MARFYVQEKGKGKLKLILFTSNLPLMWKSCNGAGGLKGEGLLDIDSSIPDKDIPNLRSRRNDLELVASKLSGNKISEACSRIFDIGPGKEPPEKVVDVLLATHPSDWLLVLCWAIYALSIPGFKEVASQVKKILE